MSPYRTTKSVQLSHAEIVGAIARAGLEKLGLLGVFDARVETTVTVSLPALSLADGVGAVLNDMQAVVTLDEGP